MQNKFKYAIILFVYNSSLHVYKKCNCTESNAEGQIPSNYLFKVFKKKPKSRINKHVWISSISYGISILKFKFIEWIKK